MSPQPKYRFALFALAAIALLSGIWAAALRLGWELPALAGQLPLGHGPLMVVGFLGTVIGLERAVAMGRRWPYGVPLFAGLGGLATVLSLGSEIGASLAALASLILVLVFKSLHRQAPAAHFVIMALSAAAWLVGNILWLTGRPLYAVTPWWVGFLVLMIAAERLQLTRIMQRSTATYRLFHAITALFLLGLSLSALAFQNGIRLSGLSMFMLALWLLRFDIARRTVREHGLPRYMAVCLLSGYFWLAIGGLLWVCFADQFLAGPRYDAMLHSIFLGFVLSMIFAHAPVIFPSITGVALPYDKFFYLHFALLHASLLVRVVSDLFFWLPGQKWGGLVNIFALLLFLGNNLRAVKLGAR